nr:hypothetical protein CFP56_68131 [Quercus suber]
MYGWSTLVHCCSRCQSKTTVDYSATVWTQAHPCSHVGADIGAPTEGKMDHGQHDELAQLFAQSMQLSQQQSALSQQASRQDSDMVSESVSRQHAEKTIDSPIHYISAHYTPTAHLRPDTTSEPPHSPPPPYDSTSMPQAMAEILIRHSIDPSALLSSQINLFYHADYEQRLRLLELWRISPPSYPLEEHIRSGWTTVEHEEAHAKQRYEQKVQKASHDEEHMSDTCVPITPIRGHGEAAWPPAARMRVASITAASRNHARNDEAEPYIVSGYQTDQLSKATDPVYAAVNLWQAHPPHELSGMMGDRYGMYDQIRNYADWERMNERVAHHNSEGLHEPANDDDDMVM